MSLFQQVGNQARFANTGFALNDRHPVGVAVGQGLELAGQDQPLLRPTYKRGAGLAGCVLLLRRADDGGLGLLVQLQVVVVGQGRQAGP